MKKILYSLLATFLLLGASEQANAQIQDLFCETFDTPAAQWNMQRTSIPSNRPNFFYLDTVVTKDRSFGSATDTVGNRTESYLTTPQIYVGGFPNVGLAFDHIAYIDQFDDATVQYSFDNGANWRRLPPATYEGTSLYDYGIGSSDWKFSKSSRSQWPNNDSIFVFTATTNAWVREDFNLTPLIDTASSDSIRIRFALIDDPASPVGGTGTHRWIIDNFCVRGSTCEIVPPTIDLLEPPRNYPARYEGRVYSTGPYDLDAQILDESLIHEAYIAVQLRRMTDPGPPEVWTTIAVDTFPMIRRPGNNFEGQIPRTFMGQTVQIGDTMEWKVVGVDASDCRNVAQDPPFDYSAFFVASNLPKTCGTQPVYQFPYFEDFNSGSFQTGRSGILAGDWENLTGDFHDWWVNQGPTDTDSTGPNTDIPGGGKYLYVESSKGSGTDSYQDSTASVVTPCFDLNSDVLPNGLVRFYVNMNTQSLEDTLTVDVFDPTPRPGLPFGRFVENVIPPISGFKGNNWLSFEFSTFPFNNTVTQFRFNGTPGSDDGKSDIAIDSFKIVEAPLIDLRLNSVIMPLFHPANSDEPVTINVQNLGVDTAKQIEFNFEVNLIESNNTVPSSTTGGPGIWIGELPPGESKNVEIPNLFYNVPLEQYQIKAWLDYPGDAVENNDTTFGVSNGQFQFPVDCRKDNFDKNDFWFTSTDADTLLNKWERGVPNYGRLVSSISAPNVWGVLLNRPYTGEGTTVSLTSPFFDLTGMDSVKLSFLNDRNIDTTKDGVWIEYSFNRGLTWEILDFTHDDERIRWYNSSLSGGGRGGTAVLSSTTGCYANTWNGWLESEIILPDTFNNQEEVLLRFRFFAENDDDGNDGFNMDNFLLYDPDPVDIEPQHLLGPSSQCDLTRVQRFNTVIKNRGTTTVNSFEIEYRVTQVSTNTTVSKTDVINRTLEDRDTLHVRSQSTFDMFDVGDYNVEIITKLPGDGCSRNDTLTDMIENIDGCSFRFQMLLSHRQNEQLPCDSTVWRFDYTSGGRDYTVSGAYNDPDYAIGMFPNGPNDTISDLFVCIKTDAEVEFRLNDLDTLIDSYSLIAFNGENDTTILQGVIGGPDSPIQTFDWFCPPQRSATPERIIVDDDIVQLPVAKDYFIEAIIRNNGLDSLDSVRVNLQIDQRAPITKTEFFSTPLKYNRTSRASFDPQYLSPGPHELTVWTSLPNGQFDMLPEDDTIRRTIFIMDTVTSNIDTLIDNGDTTFVTPGGSTVGSAFYYAPFCEDFEGTTNNDWIALNPYTASQEDISFEKGIPNTTNIMGANSGDTAWATNLEGDYPNLDESALLSPFVYLEKDSCYEISFYHNYYITDSILDGGTFRVIQNNDFLDQTMIGNSLGDSASQWQKNWFNTLHILSIPENNKNSGWTGDSKGWKKATNHIGRMDSKFPTTRSQYVAFMWRFESDGSKTGEGWAIDDFCIQNTSCFAVGLNENDFDKQSAFLGQNVPNPASSATSIPYYIPERGEVEFTVGNTLGQIVYTEKSTKPSGENILELDLTNMSKGVYYYSMVYEGYRVTKKMIITK